ncbi:hypothetical protein [uncultured Prevotella sp.]|uniref:hypothetical protein n=1 Tax=uncultured Prevotella sp. TaxID=159272 RepID=UPI0025E5AAD2|nr:hypothetical protein [uncultured Prevotella sp.]
MGIKTRIYNDFFRPSKEGEYEAILKAACDNGYEVHTMLSFEQVIEGGRIEGKKYLILRRDIDTADFKILRKMLELEKKYGVRATYYFRWNTVNVQLMKEISEAGGEASYHFEEIATYCYKHRIRSKEVMLKRIEEIRDFFISQYAKFKEKTGQPCLTIASHGDYINTRFKFQNKELIDNRVRKTTGILREAYDEPHMNALTCRIADQVEMEEFTSKAVEAIKRGEPVLELLTHPRQWNSPVWVNLKEEIGRVARGMWMRI